MYMHVLGAQLFLCAGKSAVFDCSWYPSGIANGRLIGCSGCPQQKCHAPPGVRYGGPGGEPALSEVEGDPRLHFHAFVWNQFHVRLWLLLMCDAGTHFPQQAIIDRAQTAPVLRSATRPALG